MIGLVLEGATSIAGGGFIAGAPKANGVVDILIAGQHGGGDIPGPQHGVWPLLVVVLFREPLLNRLNDGRHGQNVIVVGVDSQPAARSHHKAAVIGKGVGARQQSVGLDTQDGLAEPTI